MAGTGDDMFHLRGSGSVREVHRAPLASGRRQEDDPVGILTVAAAAPGAIPGSPVTIETRDVAVRAKTLARERDWS